MFAKRTIRQSIGISAAVSLLLCAVMLILVIFATRSTQAQPAPLPPIAPVLATVDPPIEYAPGIVIVKLKPNVTLLPNQETTAARSAVSSNHADLAQAMQAIGVIGSEPLFTLSTMNAARAASDVRAGFARTYRLQLAPAADVPMAVDVLRANDAVAYAEPDYVAHAALIPNDPEWDNQWALHKINAPDAWDLTQGAPTTVIALIDSGIDLTHPDLIGRLWQNDDTPGNGVDDDQNGKIDDVNGWNFVAASNNVAATNDHGTQVAGVAGAAGNNSLGVAGLCWHCPLMPVVAMQANGVANYSTIANAVAYAAANGAAVINLSLGGYADSTLLRETIQEAATTAVIVAAVGNDDDVTPFYPAAYPDVVAVAATDATDQKTIFSNYGPWVDIAAPGAEILTTTPGDYASPSGTSVAAPFVAGVAGLLKSLHPDWSPTLITWQILNTATTIDAINPTYLGQLGHGRLDAGAALAQPLQARAQVESYTVDGQVNGRPAPGHSFPLVLTLRNTWMPGQNVMATLATTDPYVTISDNQGAFGDIAPGQTGQNSSDPFVVTLLPDTPYNRPLDFTLTLTGANGYATSVPFTLLVRTAVETLGNTQYIQNTTWTSDKTYILNGTVIVGQGITLTIQPGTVVKGNPEKFIRVDGTLIAKGTEQDPIIFMTNSSDQTQWGGLRFTGTALSATFDASGVYIGGSILRHIEISDATTGINAGTREPYLADSHLYHNNTAILSSGGAMHISRNTFSENITAIALNGGNPIIYGNYFTRNRNETMASAINGNGLPQIINNTFINEYGYSTIYVSAGAFASSSALSVRDNQFIDNMGRFIFTGAQKTEIEHNLIANNRPFCPNPPCSSDGISILVVENYSTGSLAVRHNTIINNDAYGLQLRSTGASSVEVTNNNLFGNAEYDLYLGSNFAGAQDFTVNAANNFWNVDAAAIAERIHDCTFDENGCGSPSSTLGKVQYDPPLTEPSQSAPAFVRRAVIDPEPVGLNQIGTATIDFSRPMITETRPILTFHDARRGTIQKFASNYVRDITQDTIGRVWFSTGQGANMFDGQQWYTYTTTNSGVGNNLINAIYSAPNGDVWFGGISMFQEEAPLSRLQGSTWITYNQVPNMNQGPIMAISQDAAGAIWVGAAERGIFRFDGIAWQQFTTADGLSANYVRRIVRDGQGRMWFMSGMGMNQNDPGGLDVFDGVRWQTYNRATGMPTNAFTALFADSQGRVWASIGSIPNQQSYVAMFDGTAWHFFGPGETNGRLACPVSSFTESSNGAIWMNSCNRMVTYQADVWEDATNILAGSGILLIDA